MRFHEYLFYFFLNVSEHRLVKCLSVKTLFILVRRHRCSATMSKITYFQRHFQSQSELSKVTLLFVEKKVSRTCRPWRSDGASLLDFIRQYCPPVFAGVTWLGHAAQLHSRDGLMCDFWDTMRLNIGLGGERVWISRVESVLAEDSFIPLIWSCQTKCLVSS